MRPPVVLLGMHRSGTSMLTQLLEQMGLFLGWRKQGDHEARFFVALNDWLLTQCGGAWDHPEPLEELLRCVPARTLARDYLRLSLRSPRAISYLGPARYLRYGTPESLELPWGWKDPRMTFTLPIWLELFPTAKVVHIYRHGVDVANSLRVRHERILRQRARAYRRRRWLALLRAKQSGFSTSLRCATLEGGLSLWEKYMDRARELTSALGDRAVEIKYERFLSEPLDALERLAEFCELEPGVDLGCLAADVHGDRAYAHQRSDALLGFANRVSNRLEVFGYRGARHQELQR